MTKTNKMKRSLVKNELITDIDVELFVEHAQEIIDKATEERKKKYIESGLDRTEEEKRKEAKLVNDITLDFIKKNSRKIYGGYALNKLLIAKDPEMFIYTDEDIPDIDFYSPQPILDIVRLSNLLHKKGLKNVTGKEAIHAETFKIFVNGDPYCDITYVPLHIYNKMPFNDIEGFKIIGAEFMIVDYFRMMTDILLTDWRIEKTVKRLYKLVTHYPLPNITAPIIAEIPNNKVEFNKLMNSVQTYGENNSSCVFIGFYAYNHLLKESNFKNKDSKFDFINIPYYELIVGDYKNNTLELINKIKTDNPEIENDINTKEFYPFFQFTGHSTVIYYKTVMIAKVFSNNRKCIPFNTVNSIKFGKNQAINGTKNINIGSFSIIVLFALINAMKARVNDEKETKILHYTIVSHLTMFRNYFFESTKKTFLDVSLFQEFVMGCLGIPYDLKQEKQFAKDKKIKTFHFTYNPQNKMMDEPLPPQMGQFENTSGNEINNPKNLQLIESDVSTNIGNEITTTELSQI